MAKRRIAELGLVWAASCASGPPPVEAAPAAPRTTECTEYPARQAQRPSPAGPRDFRAAQAAFTSGLALLEAERFDEATEVLARAVEADPTHALAHLAKAEAHLYGDGETDRMLVHLSQAVLLRPDNPRAHAQLGSVLSSAGESRLARVHLRCALDLRPDLHEARYRLAVIQLEAGAWTQAESTLSELARYQGPDVRNQTLLGRVYERQGRYEEAAAAVERAARLARSNPVLLRRAATLYAQAGLTEQAYRARARADAIDPPPDRRDLRPLRPSRRR
jgi:tetratricopeptide (TPR) repeat protein